jgi:hypothetical protein
MRWKCLPPSCTLRNVHLLIFETFPLESRLFGASHGHMPFSFAFYAVVNSVYIRVYIVLALISFCGLRFSQFRVP